VEIDPEARRQLDGLEGQGARPRGPAARDGGRQHESGLHPAANGHPLSSVARGARSRTRYPGSWEGRDGETRVSVDWVGESRFWKPGLPDGDGARFTMPLVEDTVLRVAAMNGETRHVSMNAAIN